jgi:putative ABC transport system substrate-binding protein
VIERRAFVGGIAIGALAAPRIALAQSARKPYRIGVLSLRPASELSGPRPRSKASQALLQGLVDLGYVYGRDFVIEVRGSGGNPELFPALAAELVRLQVDVILAAGPALSALKQATSTIPVIMVATLDPVQQGFVQSIGHPGHNFTGFSFQAPETTGKRLELLKELVPGPAPVAVLWDGFSTVVWLAAEAAARERGWKLLSLETRAPDQIDAAFKAATSARAGSLLVFAAAILFPNRRKVANLATKHRLPAMFELREYVDAGGLIAYGADINDIWRRAAVYVDKILKGARPADLPVEQPTKFELVVNVKTARAIGLTIPPSLLARADEVIQ